jgi:hypothetical protein
MDLQKLKIEFPYDPAIPLLGIYTKESKSVYYRYTSILMFVMILFTTPIMGSAWVPINR